MKAISGGGGKGQRILNAPSSFKGSKEEQIKQAAAVTPALVREVLAEVKCNGVGDNKNVLIEMNIGNHAPPRNSGGGQRRLVYHHGRPRLLAANARTEITGSVCHPRRLGECAR
ncbi:MAG: hypothetical protein R3E67_02105 [Pseudomonadales bacterium]